MLEQTLGHVAHARNIKRALAQRSGSISSTVIPIEYRASQGVAAHIPGLRTWTFEASRQARTSLVRRMRDGDVAAVFIHTQVAALLAGSLMRRVPTVVSLDATPRNFDAQGLSYGHSRNGRAVEAIKLRLNQSVFRRAAALVSWCQWAADSLVADYGIPEEKVSVIHPGVDVSLFRPREASSQDPIRIVFVGGRERSLMSSPARRSTSRPASSAAFIAAWARNHPRSWSFIVVPTSSPCPHEGTASLRPWQRGLRPGSRSWHRAWAPSPRWFETG